MKKKVFISAKVQKEIMLRVETFNKKNLSKKLNKYYPKIKGSFVYLDRSMNDGSLEHICRLKYVGNINDMEFAIYKYSSEKYDPDEYMFVGEEQVNGTLEGAMKAGLEAYPI